MAIYGPGGTWWPHLVSCPAPPYIWKDFSFYITLRGGLGTTRPHLIPGGVAIKDTHRPDEYLGFNCEDSDRHML